MTDDALFPPRGPWIDIDLSAVCANYAMLARESGGAAVGAVVKCDSYGLGMAPIARALHQREKCGAFFVVYPQEGAALRVALNDAAPAIYCFMGLTEETAPLYERHALTPSLNTAAEANLWASRANGRSAAVHIDTGMNRVGASPREAAAIAAVKNLNVDLALSHLACASERAHRNNAAQRAAFIEAAQLFPGARLSLSASAGALAGKDYGFDMIRPGIALYGGSPFDETDDARIVNAASLRAPIVQVRDLGAGESVGYGQTFTTQAPTRIAAVAIGYGDGVPRAAAERGLAIVNGERAPIAGRISMDFTTLDVTHLKNPAKVGDIVEFFGDSLRLYEAAGRSGRVTYDLITGLGARVVRRYL